MHTGFAHAAYRNTKSYARYDTRRCTASLHIISAHSITAPHCTPHHCTAALHRIITAQMLRLLCVVGALAHCSALVARPMGTRRAPSAAFSTPVPEGAFEDDDPEKPRLISGDEADAFVAMLDATARSGGAELVDEGDGAAAAAPPAETAPTKKRWVKPSER